MNYLVLIINVITVQVAYTMINNDKQTYPTILRMPEVERSTGYKKSHIYELIKKNQFPPSVRNGAQTVGWNSKDVDNWIAEQLANVN